MLVADDYHLDAGGAKYRAALFHFFTLCATANVPLSWSKTAGCDVVSWVGFELFHRTRMLGITQRRADWLTKWSREVAAAPVVNMASFEGGLGRVMYVVSALEYERPFLAPLYRFMTMHPRGSTRKVPALRAFHPELHCRRSCQKRATILVIQFCGVKGVHPRVDAQASDDRTGVGGWVALYWDEQGRADPKQSCLVLLGSHSRGFSVGLRPRQETFTDHLNSGGACSSSLAEAFRGAATRGTAKSRVTILPTWTGNRDQRISTKQVDYSMLPFVLVRHGACRRDEEEQSQGSGRMDAEGVQP